MESTFRASLNWLHTWAGVVLGSMLFAIFWMGSLSVFDREIDRWMVPTTRLAPAENAISFDSLRPLLDTAAKVRSPTWSVVLPTERQPFLRVAYREGKGTVRHVFDPATGAVLPDPGSWAGTQFIYPFHYMLHINFGQIGVWLVGLASMGMLALCVSGVIIHRKIFADFFSFRADRKPRRLILDIHNLMGVLGFPFHVVITLSGLIVFWSVYFPFTPQISYPDRQAFVADTLGSYARAKLNKPGPTASLDAMADEARRLWDGDEPRTMLVFHPGDAASFVRIVRPYEGSVASNADMAWFDAATGALLQQRTDVRPMMTTQRFLTGLHRIQFRHWTLRWLYFALGLCGCGLIATGYLFWLESRRKKHVQLGLRGVSVVEGLTIGSVTGIIAATLAFFISNRLLPMGASFLGYERAALEAWVFYLVWISTFAHAWLRPKRAWLEQCLAIAALAVVAVLLNWVTTGDHLVRSLAHRHLWPVAGMDLLLLLAAGGAVGATRKLVKRIHLSQRKAGDPGLSYTAG